MLVICDTFLSLSRNKLITPPKYALLGCPYLQSFNATCYSKATYIQPIYKKSKARFFHNSSGISPQLADTEKERALIPHLKLHWCSHIYLDTARIISACMCRVMNRLVSWISRNLIECLEHYLWFCMYVFGVAPRRKWLTVPVAQQATMTIKWPDKPLLKKSSVCFFVCLTKHQTVPQNT